LFPSALIDVVDDNPDIRRMLNLVLQNHGFQVRTHESAMAFLEAPEVAMPRLLILDVRMPGMSGPELHAQLQAKQMAWPVIFMSGECLPHEAPVVQSAGPIGFLWKPFGTQELLQAIERGLASLESSRSHCVGT
jgi:FixJ family two-component response regulator